MANRIMGITVKIGKDTTKLQTGFLYNSKCRKNKKQISSGMKKAPTTLI